MNKFSKLAPQYKLLIAIGCLGFFAAAFYYLFIMEIDTQIAQEKSRYSMLIRELEQFKDFRGEIEIAELREQYAQVIKKIEENKRIIPAEERLPELMSGLVNDALEAGLTVLSKEPNQHRTEKFYYRIPITFEVSGSYLSLVKFLKLITQPGKRLVNVGQFDIKVVGSKKTSRKDATSPFSAGVGVVALESEILARLTIEGFAYTGSQD